MVFSSLLFLYLILPVSVLVYHLLPDVRRKNLALIVISLLLYTMGQPIYLPLMVGLCFVNYRMAFRIDPEDRRSIWIPVLINIGILGGLKYLSMVFDLFDVKTNGFVVLPMGLSIFVFSAVSYLLDIYNGTVEPEEKFSNLLLYFLMFPKLLQGPIVPYSQLRGQLEFRRHSPRAVFEGIQRFLFGMAKKVLLADACGRILESFNGAGADNTLVGVWFTAILFLFQIYYDFSGCCDMAIGLGRIFGFRYCENFNRPYMALSVTEFCSRWNISLGGFFRRYVYEPLGSDELGEARQAVNILICCLLLGLWYATGLNYLIWALYLGAVLVVELYLKDSMRFWPDWICRCWTWWLLLFGFVLFSHQDLSSLKTALAGMLGYGGFSVPGTGKWIVYSLPLLIFCIVGCTEVPVMVKRIFAGICGMDRRSARDDRITPLRIVYVLVCLAAMLMLLWVVTVAMTGEPALAPIYSKF